MDYKSIIVEENDKIGKITFNQPPLNILDMEMMKEINTALKSFHGKTLKALVLAANGKAFSAGVDVSDHAVDKVDEMIEVFHTIFENINKIKAPTVAIVNGAALGGGCEVAIFCEIVIASEKSKFGQPEIKVGVFPPIAAAIMPRLMPYRKALELLLTGDIVKAAEAKEIGLINMVLPVENFEEEAYKFVVEKIASNSAAVLYLTKKAFWMGANRTYGDAIKSIEGIYLNELMKTKDAGEGLLAFMEKRQPEWKDE
jgi:cyclohexa-1,5-dienecarbonyl-CoA hydratase